MGVDVKKLQRDARERIRLKEIERQESKVTRPNIFDSRIYARMAEIDGSFDFKDIVEARAWVTRTRASLEPGRIIMHGYEIYTSGGFHRWFVTAPSGEVRFSAQHCWEGEVYIDRVRRAGFRILF